jgi:hypothetical protein
MAERNDDAKDRDVTRIDTRPASMGQPESMRNDEDTWRRGEAGSEISNRPEARPAGAPGETASAQAAGPAPAEPCMRIMGTTDQLGMFEEGERRPTTPPSAATADRHHGSSERKEE